MRKSSDYSALACRIVSVNDYIKNNEFGRSSMAVKLGVNIDHIATLRNRREGVHPDPVRSLEIIKQAGADGVTIHLREDRRHIKDEDLPKIKAVTSLPNNLLPINFEMAATKEMQDIAIKLKPNACCIVPEKRHELTTEGGLNVKDQVPQLKQLTKALHDNAIKVSLFVDADIDQINAALEVGADIIELHTGSYCHVDLTRRALIYRQISAAANYAKKNGLIVHAGHGLCYETAPLIAKIDEISELNIGHFLIGEAIFIGLYDAVCKMRQLLDKAGGV